MSPLKVRLRRECDGVHEDVQASPVLPHLFEHAFEFSGLFDVERQENRRLELARERLDVRFRFVVEIGDRELGTERAECGCAAVGDRMLVGDADDERLLSGEDGVMGLGHVARSFAGPRAYGARS